MKLEERIREGIGSAILLIYICALFHDLQSFEQSIIEGYQSFHIHILSILCYRSNRIMVRIGTQDFQQKIALSPLCVTTLPMLDFSYSRKVHYYILPLFSNKMSLESSLSLFNAQPRFT